MCGRYTLHATKKKLLEAIGLEIPEQFEPDYNIAPGGEILSIARHNCGSSSAEMMSWGLRTPQNFHINARLESADTSPRFRESWTETRCLIPANGFYEWYQDGIIKQPYYLYPADRKLVYFAGLWFPPAFDGAPAPCVILTTEAHPSIREVHERMPVILPDQLHHDWLENHLKKAEVLDWAAKTEWQKHTVSRRVNSTQNKDSRLIEATSPQADDQMHLF